MSREKKDEKESPKTFESMDVSEVPEHILDAASEVFDQCPEVFTVSLLTRTGIEVNVHRVPWDGMIH